MSPSESDLRAALQHGDDGLGVNANAIIAQGQAIRVRRVRILSGAAAALIVAGGAVGLAFARGDGGSASSNLAGGGTGATANRPNDLAGGGSQKDAQHAPAVAPPSAAASSSATAIPGPAGGKALATTSCPESAPHLLLPGGGSSSQFGADDPLFSQPVDTLVVCVYGTTEQPSSAVPGRLTFTGQKATAIIASMEHAGRTPNESPCDPGATSTSRLLAFIGVTAGGTALPPVTATVTTPTCNVQVTNGTAVRYGWSPPAVLTGELNGLTPPKVPPIKVPGEPSGLVQGSPIHS